MENFLRTFVVLILILGIFILVGKSVDKNIFQSKKSEIIHTNFSLETPNIKDKNLIQFYLWTKEDPLFSSPDFNPDLFLATVSVLKDEEDKFLTENNLNDKIFPVLFLTQVANVNKSHKRFLENPSRSGAEELIDEYQKTISAYEKSRKDLLDKISTFNPSPPKDKFTTFNTRTSFQIIKQNLLILGNNYLEIKKEITQRQQCLEKGIGCIRPVNSFSDFTLNKTHSSFSKSQILPKDLLSSLEINTAVWNGPYIVNTPCFGWGDNFTKPPRLFFMVHGKELKDFSENQNTLLTAEARLATTIYYHKIRNNDVVGRELFSKLNKENIISQSPTNVYDCADYSFVPRLSSLDKFYIDYINKPIFQNLLKLPDLPSNVKSFLKEGASLENAFFNAEFPSENDATNLANYYVLLYKNSLIWVNDPNFGKKAWSREIFNNRDEYLNRYLEYSRNLSNINEILAHAVGNFSSLRIKYLIFPTIKDDYYIYAFRNMYPLVYLPFSSSFYRLSTPLSFLEKVKINIRYDLGGVFTYQEAIKKYTKEQIKAWTINQTLVLQKAYEQFREGQ